MTKIVFLLEQNEDGFPPVRVELINASALGDGLFKLENTPYFTANISYKDVVRASPTDLLDQFEFDEVTTPSTFTSLSIILMDESVSPVLMDMFGCFECVIEYGEFGVWRVLAVALPLDVDYSPIRSQLQALEDRSLISFAELALPG